MGRDAVRRQGSQRRPRYQPPKPPAGRIARLIAAYLDEIIVGVVALPFARAAWVGWLVIVFAYDVVPVALWGQTIAKRIVGIRVERIDRISPPGWYVASVRAAIPLLGVVLVGALAVVGDESAVVKPAVVIAAVWSLAVFAPILGPARRGLHDRAARTSVVVDRAPRGPIG